jgi:hypothetical protein
MIAILVVSLVLIAAAVAWFVRDRRRSMRLREHFGPEYNRAILGTEVVARQKRNWRVETHSRKNFGIGLCIPRIVIVSGGMENVPGAIRGRSGSRC